MSLLSSNLAYSLRVKSIKHVGQPILIWNMGKVASTSIAHSLWKTHGRRNILTTHFMNDPAHPRSEVIYREIVKGDGKLLPIITLTREPVSKNMSSFFQNFNRNTGSSFQDSKLSAEQLRDVFLNRFDKHDVTLSWFDENFQKFTGFNIYEQEFQKNKGYGIYEHGRFRFLFIRSEETNATKERAVKEFLSLSDFKLEDSNVGSKKEYAQVYREFKEGLVLSDDYLSRQLDSRYARHFYTEAEIEKVRQSWRNR